MINDDKHRNLSDNAVVCLFGCRFVESRVGRSLLPNDVAGGIVDVSAYTPPAPSSRSLAAV